MQIRAGCEIGVRIQFESVLLSRKIKAIIKKDHYSSDPDRAILLCLERDFGRVKCVFFFF